jgi:hypothetical protein
MLWLGAGPTAREAFALAAAAGGVPGAARAQDAGAAPTEPGAMAGRRRQWLLLQRGTQAALLDPADPVAPAWALPPLAPDVAPVAGAGGLWLVDATQRLQHWPWPGPDRRTAPDFEHPLPSPALALAAAGDGRWAAVAHDTRLALVDRLGRDGVVLQGQDLARTLQGSATVLIALPHRRSLLAAWPALGQWWELSLDPGAPPVFDGLVHDYRMGEAIAAAGYRHPRRIPLTRPAPWPQAAPRGQDWVVAAEGDALLAVHLDVRRVVWRQVLPGAQPARGLVDEGGNAALAGWWLPSPQALLRLDPRRWSAPPLHLPWPQPLRGAAPTLARAADGALLAWMPHPAGPGDDGPALWRTLDPAGAGWQRLPLAAPWRGARGRLLRDGEGRAAALWWAGATVAGATLPGAAVAASGGAVLSALDAAGRPLPPLAPDPGLFDGALLGPDRGAGVQASWFD